MNEEKIDLVRDDLQEVRKFNKNVVEIGEAIKILTPPEVVKIAQNYNREATRLPIELYLLYAETYVKGTSFTDYAKTHGYSVQYACKLNRKIYEHFATALYGDESV